MFFSVKWVLKHLLSQVRIRILCPKKTKFGPKLAFFWPNIGIFGPFGPIADQKMMQTRCLGSFSVTWVPQLWLCPVRIRIFGPKMPNLVQNMHFWSFWAKYWHFWPTFYSDLTQTNDIWLGISTHFCREVGYVVNTRFFRIKSKEQLNERRAGLSK